MQDDLLQQENTRAKNGKYKRDTKTKRVVPKRSDKTRGK